MVQSVIDWLGFVPGWELQLADEFKRNIMYEVSGFSERRLSEFVFGMEIDWKFIQKWKLNLSIQFTN